MSSRPYVDVGTNPRELLFSTMTLRAAICVFYHTCMRTSVSILVGLMLVLFVSLAGYQARAETPPSPAPPAPPPVIAPVQPIPLEMQIDYVQYVAEFNTAQTNLQAVIDRIISFCGGQPPMLDAKKRPATCAVKPTAPDPGTNKEKK